MSEVIAALVGVVVGAVVGYFSERAHRRADRRTDAYVDALATLQTARDAYGRVAGTVGDGRRVDVGSDFDLNRVSVRLEHDGRRAAVAGYQDALAASAKFHEAMLDRVNDRGDSAAQRQFEALRQFEDAIRAFAELTVPRRTRR